MIPVIAGLLASPPAQAQPFLGYQTPNINMAYLSVRWQGRTTLGVGISRRLPATPFTTIEAEWHFPLETMWRLTDHQIIVGAYKPLIARRPSVGIGLHARITRATEGDRNTLRFGVAASVVPFYVYAQALDNGPAGTVGARATYEAVIASRTWTAERDDWTALAAHRLELGGHLDLHLDRTFATAINAYATRTWGRDGELLEGEDDWSPQGDLLLGGAYHLRRF